MWYWLLQRFPTAYSRIWSITYPIALETYKEPFKTESISLFTGRRVQSSNFSPWKNAEGSKHSATNAPFQINLKRLGVKMLPAFLTKNPIYSICKSLLMMLKQKNLRDNSPPYAEKRILLVIMEGAFPALCEKCNQVVSNRNTKWTLWRFRIRKGWESSKNTSASRAKTNNRNAHQNPTPKCMFKSESQIQNGSREKSIDCCGSSPHLGFVFAFNVDTGHSSE